MVRFALIHAAVLTLLIGLTASSCGPGKQTPELVARSPLAMQKPDTLLAMEDSASARFYVYNPGRSRDPFVRPGTRTQTSGPSGPAEPTPPPLTIQGLISGDNPRAMINGRSVGVGDVIEGATVMKINSNSVEIEFNGKRHTIAYR